jgi:23S rRNA (guanosine2251-2'-O)-methyltransferase
VSSSSERNDRKRRRERGFSPAPHARRGPVKGRDEKDGAAWLWGWHAVVAALGNPAREPPSRLLATPERARELQGKRLGAASLEILPPAQIARELPPFAAHQGVALKAALLESAALAAMAEPARGVILMLDQLTDPQNVGALFRSAAAFGARGVVLQDRHAPALAGALAKAAAGAIEILPHARVTNLSRALEELADLGWRAVGLDAAAAEPLAAVLDQRPVVLVMGSEGEGLRRLVAEHCDALGRIPMPGDFESLNVSAAAAIALYEASRRQAEPAFD